MVVVPMYAASHTKYKKPLYRTFIPTSIHILLCMWRCSAYDTKTEKGSLLFSAYNAHLLCFDLITL